jgi:hypothetical protein
VLKVDSQLTIQPEKDMTEKNIVVVKLNVPVHMQRQRHDSVMQGCFTRRVWINIYIVNEEPFVTRFRLSAFLVLRAHSCLCLYILRPSGWDILVYTVPDPLSKRISIKFIPKSHVC